MPPSKYSGPTRPGWTGPWRNFHDLPKKLNEGDSLVLTCSFFVFKVQMKNGMASSNTLSCLCKKESRKHHENTEGCGELFAQEQPYIRSSQDVVEAGVFLIMTRGTVQIPVRGWFQDVSPSSQGTCLLKIMDCKYHWSHEHNWTSFNLGVAITAHPYALIHLQRHSLSVFNAWVY